MKTNNVINQSKPIPSWFVYLANTVSNVTGDATAYKISYDSSIYLIGLLINN